jgi:hypothetical protein
MVMRFFRRSTDHAAILIIWGAARSVLNLDIADYLDVGRALGQWEKDASRLAFLLKDTSMAFGDLQHAIPTNASDVQRLQEEAERQRAEIEQLVNKWRRLLDERDENDFLGRSTAFLEGHNLCQRVWGQIEKMYSGQDLKMLGEIKTFPLSGQRHSPFVGETNNLIKRLRNHYEQQRKDLEVLENWYRGVYPFCYSSDSLNKIQETCREMGEISKKPWSLLKKCRVCGHPMEYLTGVIEKAIEKIKKWQDAELVYKKHKAAINDIMNTGNQPTDDMSSIYRGFQEWIDDMKMMKNNRNSGKTPPVLEKWIVECCDRHGIGTFVSGG